MGSGGSGWAIYNAGGSPLIRDCVFSDVMNGDFTVGSESGAPTFLRCTFLRNGAAQANSCVRVDGGAASLQQCTFAKNRAASGTILLGGGSINVDHCIVALTRSGPAVSASPGSVTLACSDLYGNAGGDWTGSIADQLGINGNVSADPMFCALSADTLALQSTSPCAAENNPACGQIGAWSVGCQAAPGPLLETGICSSG